MLFPYIKQIHVNSCYTFQDFDIPKSPSEGLKHIIITGKNGSGKTTILNGIAHQIHELRNKKSKEEAVHYLKTLIQGNPNHSAIPQWEETIERLNILDLLFQDDSDSILFSLVEEYIFSFFKANRKVELSDVTTVTREDDFYKILKGNNEVENFTSQFKQFLVNKKVYEAFDMLDSNQENIERSKIFFEQLTNILRVIFKDNELQLVFHREKFEFYIQLFDKRKISFNNLSAGFSAFLSIFMDLFMKSELLRKAKGDYNLEPEGIVLIDEPETHTHLSMQYELLPMISQFFPRIQFIIATHSPAVISSLKNAIVYDLTSQEQVEDWLLGSSYSELMISHFGLENEFSPIADKILLDVQSSVQNKDSQTLKNILIDNAKYLTPSLRLEIESQIANIESHRPHD